MLNRVWSNLRALVCGSVLVLGAAVAPAQTTIRFVEPPVRILEPTATATTSAGQANEAVAELLRRGQSLEEQRKWGEALAVYEDGLRTNPGVADLVRRADLTKLHYDLGRRYIDGSFRKSVVTLRETEALDLYQQVLLKINSHYVQAPSWKELVNRGHRAMEIALAEPTFLERNLSKVPAERIESFQREMARAMSLRPIRDRQEAREAVAIVGRLGYQQLGLSPTATILEYTCAATGALDEYSTFLTGDQLNDLYSQIEGNFVGLGIELKASEGSLLIVNVITGSPAYRSGIQAGDRILKVSGRSTDNLTTDQAAEMLQGTAGSIVELVVATGTEAPRLLRVRREQVEVPSVDQVKIVDADYGIGYLKLTCFQKTTSRDLDAALWKLHREGMRSLIVDLRGNPGGLLTSSVEVADKFIESGTIVSTRGRNSQEDFTYTAHKPGTWPMALVVLIDGDSASASEIFAGAIADHRRGTIVGARSYGKGSVQGIFPLNVTGAGVRLTTAKFYSPTGKPYARVGVEPNVVVRLTAKPVDGRLPVGAEDEILNAGLQAAKQSLAQR